MMSLPGMYSVRITQDLRIAVGRKSDKGYPEKLDHFLLTRWDAEKKRYVQDADATAALAEHLGAEGKVTRLPICVLANLVNVPDELHPGHTRLEVPESVLWRRMAYYAGKQAVCACDSFRLKTEEELAEDGFPASLDPNNRAAWCGEARALRHDDDTVTEVRRKCNPFACGFATGAHGIEKHKGRPLCKPQAIFTAQLDWMPRLGTVAKFVTTSWQSVAKIRGSLIHIGAMNKGWIAMLPLWLVVTMETVSREGWTAPIVHVEFEGHRQALTDATLDVMGQLGDVGDGLARIEGGTVKALDSGEDAKAFSSEFAAETADDAPEEAFGSGVAAYCRGMADELGWSEAQWAARTGYIGNDEWENLVIELEKKTARTIEPTPEAEKLDVPEEEEVAPSPQDSFNPPEPFGPEADAEAEAAKVDEDGQAAMPLKTGGGHRDE